MTEPIGYLPEVKPQCNAQIKLLFEAGRVALRCTQGPHGDDDAHYDGAFSYAWKDAAVEQADAGGT